MDLTPNPEHKFAFGLWTIGHLGRDPFGDATRPPIPTADFLRGLAEIGAWGVSFHDDDLMTSGAPESQRRAELDAFKKALDETGIACSMATTNLFWHPVFKDGASPPIAEMSVDTRWRRPSGISTLLRNSVLPRTCSGVAGRGSNQRRAKTLAMLSSAIERH